MKGNKMSAYGKANNPRTVRLITDSPAPAPADCNGRHKTLDSLLDCTVCLDWLTTYDD